MPDFLQTSIKSEFEGAVIFFPSTVMVTSVIPNSRWKKKPYYFASATCEPDQQIVRRNALSARASTS
jgi:YHS domain-containing protein